MILDTNRTPKASAHLLTMVVPVFALLLALAAAPLTAGQQPEGMARSFRDRVADKATLKDGTQLWGMAISEKPPRMLIRTAWLKADNPNFFATRILPEITRAAPPGKNAIADRLQADIERLQQKHDVADQQRIGLLSEIHERLAPDDVSDPDFIIVELTKSSLRKLEKQPAARRDLCRLAMFNHIQDLEILNWKSVASQIQAIPDNMRQVAMPVKPDNTDMDRDRILAAVDVRLNTATRLIQSGTSFIDESAQADLASLVNSMLGGNLQSLLGELLDEGSRSVPKARSEKILPEAASRLAEAQNRTTVVLSAFEFDVATASATVTRRLFRKSDEGSWNLVLTASGASSAADLEPGQVEAIENDPQIGEISRLIDNFGAGNEQFSSAIRMGAVVRNAMSKAEQSFENDVQSFITTRGLSQSCETPTIVLAERDAQDERP